MSRDHLVDKIVSIAVFIALEILSVVLIYNNSTIQQSNIASAVRSVNVFFWEKGNVLNEFVNLRNENLKLAQENTALHLKLEKLAAETEILPQADSALRANSGFLFISAKTVNNTINRQHNFLILDKGTLDGVKEGMGIITANGVIGVVSACDDHYCKARSFLDTDLKISGKSLKDNNLGLISWSGKSTKSAYMTEFPTHTQIAPGDTIVTSGYSSIFPAGIPIGSVETVKSDGVSVMANLEIFENFHSLQYVYIVSNPDMETIKLLEEKE